MPTKVEIIEALEKEKEELLGRLARYESGDEMSQAVKEAFDVLNTTVVRQDEELVKLRAQVAASGPHGCAKAHCEGRHAMVEGSRYDVVMLETAKELIDQVRKRFIEEDRTVIVIDRHGA